MLNETQIHQFHRDGFLLGERVLDDQQVDALRSELARVIQDQNNPNVPQPVTLSNIGGEGSAIWQIVNIWEASPTFQNLVHNPVIAGNVAQLLGAREVRLWHDQIQYKPAGTGGVNFWHQDSLYWPLVTPKNTQVTAWIALDDVDEENGCMWMVPGSHGWGDNIEFLHSLKPTGFRSMPAERQGHQVKVQACPVKKGCVHYHHALTWHGSDKNLSERSRRAVALHFMDEQTSYIPTGRPHPMDAFVDDLKEGDKLTGDHFPLVWKDGAPVSEPLLATH
jgi:phytanoyl-CoA hydroxylase